MPAHRITATTLLLGLLAAVCGARAQAPDPEQNPVWMELRKSVFASRPIKVAANEVVRLGLAPRAEDAAVVPVTVHTLQAQTPERYVKRVWLVIDNNPSPIGVLFHMTPDSGRADIETRIRIENSTFVRAVAEMNDGELFMDVKPVSASGGCSAPSGKGELPDNFGKMRLKVDDDVQYDKPALAQLMINHPNFSGLSRSDTRVQYVKHVSVTYGGREIMAADIDFTISENPNFRFYFVPRGAGELKARVLDTNDLKFESSIAVKSGS